MRTTENLNDLNHYLIAEILSFLRNNTILGKRLRNKKIFILSLIFPDYDQFISNPNYLKLKYHLEINLNPTHLCNIFCCFVSQRNECLLVYSNSSNGIELFDLILMKNIKTLAKSNCIFSCCKHIEYNGNDYILASNRKDLVLFNSSLEYNLMFKIENAHQEWILACNLFIFENSLYIISSNNDYEYTRIWDIDKKLIACHENKKIRQIYEIILWEKNNELYYCLMGFDITNIYELKTGKVYRSFCTNDEQYYFTCCIAKKNEHNYIILSGNDINVYCIEDNVLVKNIPCKLAKGIISWNNTTFICCCEDEIIIVDFEKSISATKLMRDDDEYKQCFSLSKIYIPQFGETLVLIDKSKKLIVLSEH